MWHAMSRCVNEIHCLQYITGNHSILILISLVYGTKYPNVIVFGSTGGRYEINLDGLCQYST